MLCHQDGQDTTQVASYLLKSHQQACSDTLHIQYDNSAVVFTKKVSTICDKQRLIQGIVAVQCK